MKNKRARARRNAAAAHATREFPVRVDDSHRYARVTRALGDGRVTARCDDGAERLCRVRGKMRGREFVNVGDVVLVSVREFEPDKADVVWRYRDHEEATLRRWNELDGFDEPRRDGAAAAALAEGGDADADLDLDEAEIVFEDI